MLRRRGRSKHDPADMYVQLRESILRTGPAEIGVAPTAEHPRVYGVLMEIGYEQAVATLVSVVDGSTSLYFSTGGGIIGGGEHPDIATASIAFVDASAKFLAMLSPTTTFPSPAVGRVRFHVLTFSGGLTGEAGQDELGQREHALAPLFYAGQAVITQLRLLEERREGSI
jgi:hypothetical protein